VGASPIRLNLGCGGKILPNWVNVDLEGNWSGQKPDIVSDLRGLPFDDGVADEAQAIHVIEHFYRWEAEDLLREWMRVLKPGGLLILEAPCREKVFSYITACLRAGQEMNPRLSMWALYGDPNYRSEAMCHRWLWSAPELMALMRSIGLEDVKSEAPQTHIPTRDMRIVGRKK
jgi:predicted SAM-dependent methyltransferase